MAYVTQFQQSHQYRKMASAVLAASSAQLVLARRLVNAAIGADNADPVPPTALRRPVILLMGTAVARPSQLRSPRTVHAAQIAILLERLALDLHLAIVALSGDIVEAQMRIVAPDVSWLLGLARIHR